MAHETVKELLHATEVDREVTAKGWVRSARGNKYVIFIHINDGSTIKNIQAVCDVVKFDEETLKRAGATGACIGVTGKLVQSQGKGQSLEIQADKIEIYGDCDPKEYPLQKRGQNSQDNKPVTLPLDFLREKAHLRPRTNTFGAIFRIRHNMTFAIHKFFNDKGFYNLHSPIITGSDAEGAGEMFRVTTLDFKNIAYTDERLHGVAKQYYKKFKDELTAAGKEELIEVINKHLKEHDKSLSLFSYLTAYSHHLPEIIKSGQIEKLNSVFKEIYEVLIDRRFFVRDVSRSGEETIFFNQWFWDLLNPLAGERKVRVYLRSKDPVRYPNKFDYFKAFSFFNFPAVKKELVSSNTRKVDHTQDFFGKETNLTVSGQLEGELAALALGNIYTFGPTFRAENSNTPRHLAEFWMIEPEMAFADINDNMNIAEEMLKYLVNYALHHCKDDVQFLNDTYDNKLMERLHSVVEKHFARITYTEGVEILKAAHSKKAFEFVPDWGKDLQKEHENHLVEHFGGPVIVTGYPKDIKAFYMKQNDDGKTVRAMDILFPWIGEIIGGSQREDNYDRLYARVKEMHIPEESLWWYLETRKFGSCEHSGFGLGFERLLLFVTGMTNIRDVIPFPRTPKNAEF